MVVNLIQQNPSSPLCKTLLRKNILEVEYEASDEIDYNVDDF